MEAHELKYTAVLLPIRGFFKKYIKKKNHTHTQKKSFYIRHMPKIICIKHIKKRFILRRQIRCISGETSPST